ncbi:uncharacterized protein TNCV_1278111 [Trichonephila clavipes]|nr:uncharacterized protein TNCV_1278111 [Trichonephila clavipes]
MWLQEDMNISLGCHGAMDQLQGCPCTVDNGILYQHTRCGSRVSFPVSRARHHSKRRRRWVDVKGRTRNGCRDPKCPSAKCFCMVQEDTGVPNEGATCVWMVADEAVGCMSAFLTMSSR